MTNVLSTPDTAHPPPHLAQPPPDLTGPNASGVLSDAFLDHGPRLLSYLTRRVGSQAAEDILAETFQLAWAHRAEFDAARGSLVGWLYGISTNVLRGHCRTSAREAARLPALTAVARSDAAMATNGDIADHANGRIDAAREVRALAAAIRELPDADREVLLLSAWAGLSSAEIAEALNIPTGTVRSRLHRVRARLRALAVPASLSVDSYPSLFQE